MAYKCCRGGCMRLCFDANHRGVIAYLRRCCSIIIYVAFEEMLE